jgi:hypothetical protein
MLNAMEGKKADLVVCDGAPEGETQAGCFGWNYSKEWDCLKLIWFELRRWCVCD